MTADFEARLEALRRHLRARGDAVFLTHAEGEADAWIDTALPDAARRLADELLGAQLRAGAACAPDTFDAALDRLRAEVEAAHGRWTRPCRCRRMRAFVHADQAPDVGRSGWIDTADLPDDDARTVLDAAPDTPRIAVWHGDGRHVLRALAAAGTPVDAVVTDPPYDTGRDDLPYRDRWPEGAWASVGHEVLGLIHDVLAPHGQVVVHADEHQGATLQRLVRERFGDGWLGSVIWDKRNPKGDAREVAVQHERIEWAVRDPDVLEARGGLVRDKEHAAEMVAAARRLVATHGLGEAARDAFAGWVRDAPDLTRGDRAYRHLDEEGRVFRRVSMAWPSRKPAPPTYFTPLIHPVTGRPCPVPRRGWRYAPATLARLLDEGLVQFGPDHTTQPTRRTYLDEHLIEHVASVLSYGGSDDPWLAAKGLDFPFAKPRAVVRRLLAAAARPRDALVVDPFAGSGTTAEALLELDDRDGGRRRAVLAEIDGDVVEGVLFPRLSRALVADRWQDGRPVGDPRRGWLIVGRPVPV